MADIIIVLIVIILLGLALKGSIKHFKGCLLYTSDAADD